MPGDDVALLIAELELRISEQDKVIADLNEIPLCQESCRPDRIWLN
ncbi:MAG: hypothetical protein NTZ54_19375 [Alphaproteobacteria bacterium]|nr:hypothetical protein [Alphaproteobacteria bacterium]